MKKKSTTVSANGQHRSEDLFYKAVLESTFDVVGIFSPQPEFKTVYLNQKIKLVLGYTKDERLGQSPFEVIHPDEFPKAKAVLKRINEEPGKQEEVVVKCIHKDGSDRFLNIVITNLCHHPEVLGYAFNYRDITEKVLMQHELAESQEKYKRLVDTIQEGIVQVDNNDVITFTNDQFCKMTGYSSKELIGHRAIDFFLEKGEKDKLEKILSKRKKGQSSTYELQLKSKGVSKKWFRISGSPMYNSNGDVIGSVGLHIDITEQKLTEQRYQDIFENSHETIVLLDPKTKKFIDFNHNATELFGLPRKELIKKGPIVLSPVKQPDGSLSREKAKEKVLAAIKGKKPVFEWLHIKADGTEFPCEIRLVPIRYPDGTKIRGTVTDITERKKIENQLEKSRTEYTQLAKLSPVGIFKTDLDGNSIYANEKWCEIAGITKEQSDGNGWLNSVHEDDREIVRDEWIDAVKKLRDSKLEYRYKRPDGKITWVFGQAIVEKDNNGKPIGYIGTVTDITDRKNIEHELIESRKAYQQIVASSPSGIFKTDNKGNCTFVNRKWCEITGLNEDEAMGNGWVKAVHPDDRNKVSQDWRKAVKQHSASSIEYRFVTPEGKITWVFGQAATDRDSEDNFIGFSGTITDITTRKITEQALAKSELENRALLTAIPDLILRVSGDGRYLDVKPTATFKTYVAKNEIVGRLVTETLPEPAASKAINAIKKAIKTRKIQTYSYSLPGKNSSEKEYFEARVIANGKNEAIALIRDETQRKKDEILIKESEERWRSLVENAPNYITTLDVNQRVMFLNHPPIDETNYLGKVANDFVDKKYRKPLKEAIEKAIKNKETVTIEVTATDKSGNVNWYMATYAPLHNSGKEQVIGLIYNITEKVNYANELRSINQRLAQLNHRLENIREEEKKKIAIEIHDELGQQLTAIKLGAFWLQSYLEKGLDHIELTKLNEKIETLLELSTNSIRSIRRISQELRPVILDSLGLIPAIEWHIGSINESTSINCTFQHRVKKLKLKKDFSVALFRIVQEALTNIIKHSKAKNAQVILNATSRQVIIVIKDDGIGIDGKPATPKAGIGIFGIKERTKNWKGKFLLNSNSKDGTEMRISFPHKNTIDNR